MKAGKVVLALAMVVSVGCTKVDADASGQEIVEALCVRCHGDDLQGNNGPALGAGSEAVTKTDEYVVATITRGRGRMPSFSGSLTTEQILRVLDYLREVQER